MAKKERHVFPSSEIPHLWAHKTQADARNNGRGNLFFEGDTIYSYGRHFPIARWVKSGKREAVLFTERGYSNTTAKHKGMVRSAIPAGVTVFTVPDVRTHNHEANLQYYVSQAKEFFEKALRAVQVFSFNWKINQAREFVEEGRQYAKFFRLKSPKFPNVSATAERKRREYLQEREAVRQTPEYIAKRGAEREKRDAAKEAARLKAAQEAITEWRAGNPYARVPYGVPTMLRVKGEEVETSRGARVPVSHAKRLLRFVRGVVKSGQEYVRNGHTIHVGHYPVDKIEANGTLHAGCHVIGLDEIERVAPEVEAVKVEESREE